MMESDNSLGPLRASWQEIAVRATLNPGAISECPICHAKCVTAAWNLIAIRSREATVDLECGACDARHNEQIRLPDGVVQFFPQQRMLKLESLVKEELVAIGNRIRLHAKTMPAAAFTTHPKWAEARWSATTFRWHPTGGAPPVMGLVFDNAEAAKEIFREAERQMNHLDRFEEIRISIIEGPVVGQEHRPGYSVHISPDPEALAAHATAEDFVVDQHVVPFLGQWNRHYPIPGNPELLPRFKKEFAQHKEFMLAPVVRKPDGQLWFECELGIIKNLIEFRQLPEISGDDPDAAALVLPSLITPPR